MTMASRRIFLLDEHVCPWWFGYTFDNALRRLVHNPKKILGGFIKEGQTVMDIGCGMGFFSISMAKMVGEDGTVIAVDLQQNMLKVLRRRAERNGVLSRIRTHQSKKDDIRISDPVDFALAFWVVHEIPNKKRLFEQIYSLLRAGGRILVVEPKIHVSPRRFNQILQDAMQIGLTLLDSPSIRFSRSALLEKPENQKLETITSVGQYSLGIRQINEERRTP